MQLEVGAAFPQLLGQQVPIESLRDAVDGDAAARLRLQAVRLLPRLQLRV